jgi:hypothetical protein
MLDRIHEPTLIAECQLEDFGRLQFWPLRIAEPANRRGKHFVAAVLMIGEQAHPFIEAPNEPDLLGAVILVLLAVAIT